MVVNPDLAQLMVKLGRNAGRRMTAVIASMEAPLGAAVDNALEVAECVGILSGQEDLAASADLWRLFTVLAGEMLYLGGLAADRGTGWRLAEEALTA